MSTIAISSLPVATSIEASDVLPIVQSGVTKQLTKTLLFSSMGTPGLGTPISGVLTNCTGLPNAGLLYSSITFGGTTLALGTVTSTIANDVTFNGLTIGRGRNSINTNTALGNGVLGEVTTATDCTAVGASALFSNTTGARNTAVGASALASNLTGVDNVAVGVSALESNLNGINNVAIGGSALFSNTSGSSNVAIGESALNACISGAGNTTINALNSSGTYAPVFDVTTEDNRFVAGSTAVTNAYVQVAWTVVSDARDKTDFAPVPHGLDFVTKLQPTAYRYKANRSDTEGHGPLRYGFKAQDVLALEGDNPVIVDAEVPEKLKLNDQSMIAVLVNAIQELKAEFDAYKAAHP